MSPAAAEPVAAEWSPVSGCSPASIGCKNCAALKVPELTSPGRTGPMWNGRVRFNEAELDRPLSVRNPHLLVVCPHGDLFHEAVPDEWIARVFGVVSLASWHNFQILTKRAARMRAYVNRFFLTGLLPGHIWLSVSAERQKEADERIPELLATHAAAKFVTLFPMLGPVSLPAVPGFADAAGTIRAVVYGGEPQRPMRPEWGRQVEDDCAALGIPCGRSDTIGAGRAL